MESRKAKLVNAAIAGLLAVGPAVLISSSAFAADKGFKCEGGNMCNGKGECGGTGHSCSGKAEEGKGWITTKDAKACDAAKAQVAADLASKAKH